MLSSTEILCVGLHHHPNKKDMNLQSYVSLYNL